MTAVTTPFALTVKAYRRAVCYAAKHGLPHPGPLSLGNGKVMMMA
jgi:hypothetical protein